MLDESRPYTCDHHNVSVERPKALAISSLFEHIMLQLLTKTNIGREQRALLEAVLHLEQVDDH
jgi:hypothetical protein